jgi:hypothetical protein
MHDYTRGLSTAVSANHVPAADRVLVPVDKGRKSRRLSGKRESALPADLGHPDYNVALAQTSAIGRAPWDNVGDEHTLWPVFSVEAEDATSSLRLGLRTRLEKYEKEKRPEP